MNLKFRYDELMQDGSKGHYEVMEQVFKEMVAGETPTLTKFIEQTCREAWRQEHNNTTINDMICWILKQILPAITDSFENDIKELKSKLINLEANINNLKLCQCKELTNG